MEPPLLVVEGEQPVSEEEGRLVHLVRVRVRGRGRGRVRVRVRVRVRLTSSTWLAAPPSAHPAAAAPPAAAAAARVVLSSDAVEAGPNQRHASYPKKPTYPPRNGTIGRAASAAGSVAAVAPAWLQATGAAPAQAASCARIVAST